MSTKQCMGGWCSKRAKCPHYHAEDSGQEPAERLCEPGSDGTRIVDASVFRTIRENIFSEERKRAELPD